MSPACPKRCVGKRPVSPAEDLPTENLRERSAIRLADHWGGSIHAPSVLDDVRSRLRGARWLNVTNADLFYTSRGSRAVRPQGEIERRHPAATIDPSVGHCLDLSTLCQSGTLEFRSESVHRLSSDEQAWIVGLAAQCRVSPPSTQPQVTAEVRRLKLRYLSLSEFQFAIFHGFSYSYSALAVLVLEETASSRSTSTISLSTSTRRAKNSATSKATPKSHLARMLHSISFDQKEVLPH
jgi:hypothetical protein